MTPFPYIDRVQRRFSMGSDTSILDDAQLWVHNRDTVIRPGLGDVGGMEGFFFPPVAGGDARVALLLDGERLRAESYEWRPGEFVRSALGNGLEVHSQFVVAGGGEAVLTVSIKNTQSFRRRMQVEWKIEPAFGAVPSEGWGWVPPKAVQPCRATRPAKRCVAFTVDGPDPWTLALATSGRLEAHIESRSLVGELELEAGAGALIHLTMALGSPASAIERADCLARAPMRAAQQARRETAKRLSGFLDTWPRFLSPHLGLEAFYDRGMLTFFTCVWESDAFLLKPHMAESGIDGGAICTYLWGVAYIAKLLAISRPDLLRAHILQALRSKPFEHYAYTPLDGRPIGPWYSYNQFCIVWCVYHYALLTGDFGFLREIVDGKTVYEWALEQAIFGDDLDGPPLLVDYCGDINLLELRRTDAYRHYVPSPNAERCWSMRAVDEMASWIAEPDPHLTPRAFQLADLIQEKLWHEDLGWFGTLDSAGNPRICWTIQVFDMLRFDVLEERRKAALLRHLNDDEFLSAYGVHSLSKTDVGYDESDVDWGGPGVYAGDAPELVEDLYHAGAYPQGDDVLSRILWWGNRFPYYPQAIRADSVDYRRDGRANVIVGLKACEALVFGLAGLRVEAGGAVSICPHLPAGVDDFAVKRLRVRGKSFDLAVSRKGYRVVTGKRELCKAQLGIRSTF